MHEMTFSDVKDDSLSGSRDRFKMPCRPRDMLLLTSYLRLASCTRQSPLTRGSRVSSRVGALCNLATRLETKNVRQNVKQTFTQNENQ